MFVSSLRYPLESDDLPRTLLIGSLLVVGSILILPLIVLMGYFVQAINAAAADDPPPQFERFEILFVDGLKLLAVGLAYGIGFVVLAFGVLFVGALNEQLMTVCFVVLAIAYFGLLYFSVAVLYAFGRHRNLADAFALRDIVRTGLSVRYLLVALLVVLIVPTLFSILQVLVGITIIGLLLIPATLVYELLVYAAFVSELDHPDDTAASS